MFQIALWEIIFEDYTVTFPTTPRWDVNGDDFQWQNGGALNDLVGATDLTGSELANLWLSEINGKDANGENLLDIDLIAWVSPIDGECYPKYQPSLFTNRLANS